jgi:hypothetical protein
MAQPGQSPRFEFTGRISLAKNEDYHLELDDFRRGDDQFLMLHCRVFRWKPSVLKRMLADWKFIRSVVVTQTLFASGDVDDDKFRRWCALFGFQPLMPVITECGEPRSLYVHHGLTRSIITNHQFIGHDEFCPVGTTAELPAGRLAERAERLQSS